MKTKNIVLIGVIIFAVILIFSAFGVYNTIVKYDENTKSTWSQVENVYQRRADLIPNLVNTVKGYAAFEKETLTQVIEARAKATSVNVSADNLNAQSLANFQKAQGELSSALSRLMVVVEKYPELKANQNFLELQSQLEGSENRIAVERQRFNNAVNAYNSKIRTFPAVMYAAVFGFTPKAYFMATRGADVAPKVQF